MCEKFHLNRTLFNDNQLFPETELLSTSKYIVILAEPGAGKTELLNSFAKQLGVKEVTVKLKNGSVGIKS